MTEGVKGANRLFALAKKCLSKNGLKQLEKAFDFACEKHKDQRRKSGELYIEHPVAVANILAELKLDADTLSAALLHDVIEDTSVTLEEIRREFNSQVAEIIEGVTKLEKFKFKSQEEQESENIRKMLIAVARDVRVILVKLADRLHNMETIDALDAERQKEIAEETLEVYASIAHRFGIFQMKWKLEDMAFAVLYPKIYEHIQRMVAERRTERERYIKHVEKIIGDELKKNGINAEVSGRVKHFYSIYEKMVSKGLTFDEIMDLTAVRVIVDTVPDCYAAMGFIHGIMTPVPGRIKDYIAVSKMNMYRSLHTVVIGPEGRKLEIQIRTHEMHRTAEYGIAAHWLYKESRRREHATRAWLKQVLDWQRELTDPSEFMKTLKIELFQDEVFTLTPAGKVISLPKGATPIDFAFAIHTDVGHSCIGAKVNGKMVPLTYQLKNGDVVEIMRSKVVGGPSRDWLNVVVTSRARTKIKQWFSKERREDEITEGREEVERALRRKGLGVHTKEVTRVLAQVSEDLRCKGIDELYRLVGAGHISGGHVANRVSLYLGGARTREIIPEKEPKAERALPEEGELYAREMLIVPGIDNALVTIARCCSPSPPDEIVGFVTRGRGVSVHRRDCVNLGELAKDSSRLIKVSWAKPKSQVRVVEICVKAIDRPKLVRDITHVLGEHKINILSASFSSDQEHMARSTYSFEVASDSHLEEVIREIKKVDSVYDVFEVSGTRD